MATKKFNVKMVSYTADGTAIVRDGKNVDLEHFSVDCETKNARDIKRIVCDSFSNVRSADVVIENVDKVVTVLTYVFEDISSEDIVNALISAGYEYHVEDSAYIA